MMIRTDIINLLIKENNYKSYLEVGVFTGYNFKSIIIDDKSAVDPDPKIDIEYKMTSDDFFKQNDKMYDIIFIDGLHIDEQVQRDIENSLMFLNDGGIIVVHDCKPIDKNAQSVSQTQEVWNGDVWKAWIKTMIKHDDLIMRVVDTDCGVGLIQKTKKGKGTHIDSFNDGVFEYDKNTVESALNLISEDSFIKLYSKKYESSNLL